MKIIIGKHEATIYREGNGYTGAISLGFDATGRRRRVMRKGRTKAGVKDKLREVVHDLDAGVSATASYPVQDAVADFFDYGLKGKSAQTVANYRSIADHHLIPFIGAANLKKLTADELDAWLDDRAEELSTRTLRLVHQILERAIRHAQARDKVRRSVASLVILPEGQEGRPSRAMTLDQAVSVLDQAGPGSRHRLAAYMVVSLLAGIRTEEARGGPQRHDGHRDRLPARDQASADHRRHGHGPDPRHGTSPSPAPQRRARHAPAAITPALSDTAWHPKDTTGQAADPV